MNSADYITEVLFTFGSGVIAIILSLFLWKYTRLFALSGIVVGLLSITLGIKKVLEENGVISRDHFLFWGITIVLFIVFLLLLFMSSLNLTKENTALRKRVNISFAFLLVFLIPLLGLVVYAGVFKR